MKKIFKHQQWHILHLTGLLMLIFLIIRNDPSILDGSLWGIKTLNWFLFAIAIPVFHQIYVLVCWRLELHFKSITRFFGDNGFRIFKVIFAAIMIFRPISILLLAISNFKTFPINIFIMITLTVILLIPAAYLFYSIFKYFGIDRAFGYDHFYPEEAKILPFVSKGIFRFTENAMYKYGFLMLWIPGILFQSKAALLAALFNHIYI